MQCFWPKLLCAGVTLSVSEGPGRSFTALGNLKAGQMDEQAEGEPFPACAVLTGAPECPSLGHGQMPLETASWDLLEEG